MASNVKEVGILRLGIMIFRPTSLLYQGSLSQPIITDNLTDSAFPKLLGILLFASPSYLLFVKANISLISKSILLCLQPLANKALALFENIDKRCAPPGDGTSG